MNITAAELLSQYHRARTTWPFIALMERDYGFPDGLLFAVGSRETNLTNEIGDGGHGHGVWQLDDRSHSIPLGFDTDVLNQCGFAAEMLNDGHVRAQGSWLRALNAYNSGQWNTAFTAGGDYGPDVLERQACIQATILAGGASPATTAAGDIAQVLGLTTEEAMTIFRDDADAKNWWVRWRYHSIKGAELPSGTAQQELVAFLAFHGADLLEAHLIDTP